METLQKALALMQGKIGRAVKISSMYESEPVGNKYQPWFLNCCAEIETTKTPEEVLGLCQEIENLFGRERLQKWAARTLDIDILFYGSLILDMPNLKIPHSEARKRRFVLMPLAEIAPDFVDPAEKKSIKELLRECADRAIVRML